MDGLKADDDRSFSAQKVRTQIVKSIKTYTQEAIRQINNSGITGQMFETGNVYITLKNVFFTNTKPTRSLCFTSLLVHSCDTQQTYWAVNMQNYQTIVQQFYTKPCLTLPAEFH